MADLKSQLVYGLYDRHVTDADGVVNLVDILDEVGEGTKVISVTGLEASPHLHDILALANNAQEEFRKRFKPYNNHSFHPHSLDIPTKESQSNSVLYQS